MAETLLIQVYNDGSTAKSKVPAGDTGADELAKLLRSRVGKFEEVASQDVDIDSDGYQTAKVQMKASDDEVDVFFDIVVNGFEKSTDIYNTLIGMNVDGIVIDNCKIGLFGYKDK